MSRESILITSAREFVAGAETLASTVRRAIQVESATKNLYEQKSGRIHSRALFKVPTGENRVFAKKVIPALKKDTAFTVLGDASGSMHGPPFASEIASFVILGQVFRALQIPHEFLMFSENQDPMPEYFVLKAFEKKATDEDIFTRCDKIKFRLGNNPDGEALLWAWERLRQRKEKRRILIVLSDGQPSTRAHGDAATHLRVVADAISKQCELHAIGLMCDSPRLFYKNWKHSAAPSDLAATFLEMFKELLIK